MPVFAEEGLNASDFLISLYRYLDINYARFYKMDNLSRLGWLASEVLLKDSFNNEDYQPEDIALVLSNANASLDTDLRYMNSVNDTPSPSVFVYTLPNIVTGEICIRNGFKGENAFFISEQFDSGFIESYVNDLFDSNVVKACICGWVELLGDDYKAFLFLIENKAAGESVIFSTENMNSIAQKDEQKLADDEVYIAGAGVIAAIGNNLQECLASFEKEEAGIGEITFMNTVHKGELPVAEVKLSNKELADLTGLPEDISRTTLLGLKAAREALADADIPNINSMRVGFVSANTVGGMDKSEAFFVPFLKDNSKGKLRNVFDHECGSVTEIIADHLGIKDYMTTISTACSSSANSIFYGTRLIKNDMLDVVVAGGADALTKFTLNGFNTLMIVDKEPCKPFDENRLGLNLGEGAGYVVLVSAKVARTLNKAVYCKLSGYNNSNDAYHQTASSPDGKGSYMAMQGALEKSGLQPSDISYINLHGTGTPNNDSAEGTAVKRIFDPHYPPVSSTKSFTGHTLGASGGIEAVFSVMAVKNGLIYPNLRFENRMHELPFSPETRFKKGADVQNVMSNSFGFGGNCTSLIFSKV